ncbi:MAG: tetratricopeptide repeat protein [Sphingobacteriales bacterium]|nr:MAG: tetratricopeptide repeat protein [Sphingobacteriales bacterium]
MANTVRNQPGVEKITVEESNPLNNIERSYEQNKKRINTILAVVVLGIVGFLAYKNLYKAPQEAKASHAMSFPQAYFQQDSLNKALNGDGQHFGFLKIASKYGGTKAGNLANYFTGLCYLQMKDHKSAIKYLKEFDAHGTSVQYPAYGALGDAYMETGNTKEGIESYMKAAGNKNDNVLTPIYLYRAALAYEMNNQPEKAKENYKRIRDEYPQSMQANETTRNLARLGVLD